MKKLELTSFLPISPWYPESFNASEVSFIDKVSSPAMPSPSSEEVELLSSSSSSPSDRRRLLFGIGRFFDGSESPFSMDNESWVSQPEILRRLVPRRVAGNSHGDLLSVDLESIS